MKFVNAALIGILLVLGLGAIYSQVRPNCAEPIRYSIGKFDSRFGIKRSEFIEALGEAEKIWEKEAKRELFVYDPAATFKVNLTYDERQERTAEYSKIMSELESSENQFKTIEDEYASTVARYDALQAEYSKGVTALDRELASYNREVDYWNARGGAPEKKFNELKAEQARLDRETRELEEARNELNALSRRINILADRGNRLANNYNATVSTYNQRFGTSSEFDQGDYRGDEINLYQFRELSDLIMVAAHEFGHAIGIDHTEDPKSVMYYFMGEQDLNNLVLTAEDVAAMKSACGIE